MLDLKHLREFAFSMTARQSGKSIVALIDEIEALQAENARLREALETSKLQIEAVIEHNERLNKGNVSTADRLDLVQVNQALAEYAKMRDE